MNNSLQRTLGDFINGLKNVKAYSAEEWFHNRFSNESKKTVLDITNLIIKLKKGMAGKLFRN